MEFARRAFLRFRAGLDGRAEAVAALDAAAARLLDALLLPPHGPHACLVEVWDGRRGHHGRFGE